MSSNMSRRNELNLLHPVVRKAVQHVSEQLKKEQISFRVFETFRSPERQRNLYAQGRTAPGDIVTKARPWSSYHQYGLAVDFVLFIDGKWSWRTDGQFRLAWERLHEIAREQNLEPLSWELPHLQYASTSLERLKRGDYPPNGDDDWAEALQAAVADWDGAETAPPPPVSSGRPALEDGALEDEDEEVFAFLSPVTLSTMREQPERGLTGAVIQAAQASERLWGIPTSLTLAQFVLESAGGKSMPPGSNNPFGIKARQGEPFVTARTWEVVNGRRIKVFAKFRKFASFDEAFSDHGRLLATSSFYRKAMSLKHDPEAFAHALTGIYATDPEYGAKLVKLINQLDLKLYDASATAAAQLVAAGSEASALGLQLGNKGENVTALQQALKRAGYSVGTVDDVFGPLTQAGVLAFQADNSLPTTGIADSRTLARLNASTQRPLSRERLAATEEDLKHKGSQTILEAQRTRMLGLVTSVLGGLGIGNSVIVNSVGETSAANGPAPVEAFLSQVSTVLASPQTPSNPAQLADLARTANNLLLGMRGGESPELVQMASQLLRILPTDVVLRYPDLERVLAMLTSADAAQPVAPRTVFDLLPAMFAQGGNLETIASGAAALASSAIPGLGGSVGALAIGLLARHFGNKIAETRLKEHHDGRNLGR